MRSADKTKGDTHIHRQTARQTTERNTEIETETEKARQRQRYSCNDLSQPLCREFASASHGLTSEALGSFGASPWDPPLQAHYKHSNPQDDAVLIKVDLPSSVTPPWQSLQRHTQRFLL